MPIRLKMGCPSQWLALNATIKKITALIAITK